MRLAPAVGELAARLFRMGDPEGTCPGETKCFEFQQAADEDIIYEQGPNHRPEEDIFIGKRLGKCSACIGCPKLITKPGQKLSLEADLILINELEQFNFRVVAGQKIDMGEMSALECYLWIEFKKTQDMYERAARNRMAASLEALGMFR